MAPSRARNLGSGRLRHLGGAATPAHPARPGARSRRNSDEVDDGRRVRGRPSGAATTTSSRRPDLLCADTRLVDGAGRDHLDQGSAPWPAADDRPRQHPGWSSASCGGTAGPALLQSANASPGRCTTSSSTRCHGTTRAFPTTTPRMPTKSTGSGSRTPHPSRRRAAGHRLRERQPRPPLRAGGHRGHRSRRLGRDGGDRGTVEGGQRSLRHGQPADAASRIVGRRRESQGDGTSARTSTGASRASTSSWGRLSRVPDRGAEPSHSALERPRAASRHRLRYRGRHQRRDGNDATRRGLPPRARACSASKGPCTPRPPDPYAGPTSRSRSRRAWRGRLRCAPNVRPELAGRRRVRNVTLVEEHD